MTQMQAQKTDKFAPAFFTISFIAVATGIGLIFRQLNFPETNVVVVYILSVLLTARFTSGYGYGIAACVLATAAFNYFFTAPYLTLSVIDPSYFITFFIMTLTAVVTSALTTKVKETAFIARRNEAETNALYELTNRLTDAADIQTIASLSVKMISEILNCLAACVCFKGDGSAENTFIQQQDKDNQVLRETDAAAMSGYRLDNLTSPAQTGAEFYDWPIQGRDSILGLIRIPIQTAQQMTPAQIQLLQSMIESTALAMDRLISVKARIESNEEAIRQRDRGNLLRAISHDLRTPLSGIMGTSEMLMSMMRGDEVRYQLAFGIYKDADWLHGLVENILNLTRLQEGRLLISKQKEAVEEVVGVAVAAISKRAPDRVITVQIPPDVLMVFMDARLIQQVLVNLLANAVSHTLPGQEINILVSCDPANSRADFIVSNNGEGISGEDLPHVFEMFYTTRGQSPDSRRGMGLGLAICQSIVFAHGGTIVARNREGGPGAEFIFTLPMGDTNDTKQR